MTGKHPVTGAVLVRGVRSMTLRLATLTTVIGMPGWYALDDLAGIDRIHDPDDIRVYDLAMADLKRQYPA